MRYRLARQCPDCKKIYTDYFWYVRVACADFVCPKCGYEGRFDPVVARRRLLLRWEVKKGKRK